MKKVLLASVLAIASSVANAADEAAPPDEAPPPPRVRVAPAAPPIPPLGWVWAGYIPCANPQCGMVVVNVDASGLNVRAAPNEYPVMSLVNGMPLYPLQRVGDWVAVAPACDLTPTWLWSWTAGVPLYRCWVYF